MTFWYLIYKSTGQINTVGSIIFMENKKYFTIYTWRAKQTKIWL